MLVGDVEFRMGNGVRILYGGYATDQRTWLFRFRPMIDPSLVSGASGDVDSRLRMTRTPDFAISINGRGLDLVRWFMDEL